jgi:hypothetical protein
MIRNRQRDYRTGTVINLVRAVAQQLANSQALVTGETVTKPAKAP